MSDFRLTPRQNLIEALEGRLPERIPYIVLDEFIDDGDPAWKGLFDAGACRIPFASTVADTPGDSQIVEEDADFEGRKATKTTVRTPVGSITQVSVENWVQEYFLKTPADYRVMEHHIRNLRLEPAYESFRDEEKRVGENGLALIDVWLRTPLQMILVDYAGLENFSGHFTDGFPELSSLAEAIDDRLVRTCEIVAKGPGRYMRFLENLTAEAWGPERFRRYHMPAYEKMLSILHAGGKRVYPHYDGKLSSLAGLIGETSFDGIDGLTTAPEGDLTYSAARQAWPGKFIWGNLNLSIYDKPESQIRDEVAARVKGASPDGRLFALEDCEDLPQRWRESMPIVLDALGSCRRK